MGNGHIGPPVDRQTRLKTLPSRNLGWRLVTITVGNSQHIMSKQTFTVSSGNKVLPWLGDMNNLAPVSDFIEPPYGEDDSKSPFPVRPADRRSYSQNCVVWIKPSGLQVFYNT